MRIVDEYQHKKYNELHNMYKSIRKDSVRPTYYDEVINGKRYAVYSPSMSVHTIKSKQHHEMNESFCEWTYHYTLRKLVCEGNTSYSVLESYDFYDQANFDSVYVGEVEFDDLEDAEKYYASKRG